MRNIKKRLIYFDSNLPFKLFDVGIQYKFNNKQVINTDHYFNVFVRECEFKMFNNNLPPLEPIFSNYLNSDLFKLHLTLIILKETTL